MSKYIGYYNSHNYPVQFSMRSARSAPMKVETRQPIVDGQGFLVPDGVPELDHQVQLGVIAKIPAGHKDFFDWNEKVEKRSKVRLGVRSDSGFPEDGPRPVIHNAKAMAAANRAEAAMNERPGAEMRSQSYTEGQDPEIGSNTFVATDDAASQSIDDFIDEKQKAGLLNIKGNNQIEYGGQTFRGKKALAQYLTASARN